MNLAADSRVAAGLEVAAVFVANYFVRGLLRQLDLGIGVGAFGILVPLALAGWLLHRRGIRWRDLGLRRPDNLHRAAAWALGLFLLDMLVLPAIVGPLSDALGFEPQRLGAFSTLPGNTFLYLVLLIPVSWGAAAFGEELLYRGFYFARISDALGHSALATSVALLGQATLFAIGHAYLGPRGMLNAGALGLAAGIVYRACGRNLWPLIVAHGLVDSVGITALYLGFAHG